MSVGKVENNILTWLIIINILLNFCQFEKENQYVLCISIQMFLFILGLKLILKMV